MFDFKKSGGRMTRREWIGAAGGVGLFFGVVSSSSAGGKFWNKKDAAHWSDDEVLQLVTDSPWAMPARVLPKPGRDKGSFSAPPPDYTNGGAGGTGAGGGGRGGREPGAVDVVPVIEVTVVWESAQPFRDSLKTSFPSDFDNHYVIGVHKLPMDQGKHKVNLQDSSATLQARGRDPVGAGVIQPEKDYIICGFSKELLPLRPTDRDIVFSLETEQYSIKTKFDPRQMMYKGALAV
jgi:hypothetical protein